MSPDHWQRLKALLDQALELPEEQRTAFVEQATVGSPELREELLAMLAGAGADDSVLHTPAGPREHSAGVSGRRLGDFELVSELGSGGMGVVWLARQVSLDREVAVKVLPHSPVLTERAIARFQREARAAGRLSHPGITPVHSVGRDGDTHFFAMEYIPGHDLRHEIELQRDGTGRAPHVGPFLPPQSSPHAIAAVATVVRDVARALQHAHEHGVVHRDVKPHNILLDRAGHPHLVDFGLARDESFGSLSRSGDLAGTPHYMSPEQVKRGTTRVDHRTDVFSLGVVLFELLTLRRPFEGRTSQDVLHRISLSEPPPLRRMNVRVPRDLATVCAKALAKDPDKRYASAGALADDLDRFLRHESVLARPEGALSRMLRAARRHQLVSAAIVALILCALAWKVAGVRADGLQTDQQLASLERLLAQPDWNELAVLDALPSARATADALRRRLADDDGEPPVLERFTARLDTLRAQWLERAPQVLSDVIAPWQPGALVARRSDPSDAVLQLHRVTALFPDDARMRELTSYQALQPSLDVTCEVPGAVVSLRSIDPFTGQPGVPRELGPAPVRGLRLYPGYYRVEVSAPGHRTGEFSRLLRVPLSTTTIVAALRADTEAGDDMLLVPAAVWRTPTGESDGNPDPVGEQVPIEAFLIDRREVSIAEYRAFLRATGRKRPAAWPDQDAWDAAWDDLPATGMTWDDTRAYTEWVGKRLPTHHEWELAARGVAGRPFPWGDGPPGAGPAPALTGQPAPPLASQVVRWAHFASHAVPVRSPSSDATPEGVMHLLGNVKEWTESLIVSQPDPEGGATFIADARWVMGASFGEAPGGAASDDDAPDGNAAAGGADLTLHSFTPASPDMGQLHFGFRCARSLTP